MAEARGLAGGGWPWLESTPCAGCQNSNHASASRFGWALPPFPKEGILIVARLTKRFLSLPLGSKFDAHHRGVAQRSFHPQHVCIPRIFTRQ